MLGLTKGWVYVLGFGAVQSRFIVMIGKGFFFTWETNCFDNNLAGIRPRKGLCGPLVINCPFPVIYQTFSPHMYLHNVRFWFMHSEEAAWNGNLSTVCEREKEGVEKKKKIGFEWGQVRGLMSNDLFPVPFNFEEKSKYLTHYNLGQF